MAVGGDGFGGCGADYGAGALYDQRYEHAVFDGKTAFDCDAVTLDASSFTIGFGMKPSKAFTGSVLSLNDASTGTPYLSVGIEVGGWVTASLSLDPITGLRSEVQVKQVGLLGKASGKSWVSCHVLFSEAKAKLELMCGEQKETATLTDAERSVLAPPSALKLSLGSDDAHKPTSKALMLGKGFKGAMDDVRLYDVSLRKSAIKVNAHNELSGDEYGLSAYYRMGEEIDSASLAVLDGTGNGKHCSIKRHGGLRQVEEHFAIVELTKRRLAQPDPAPILTAGRRKLQRRLMGIPGPRRALQSSGGGSGTSARSCLELKLNELQTASTQYIVSVNGSATKVYCDMEREGGGWTLLLNNAGGGGFTSRNLLKRFSTMPSVSSDYSMLGLADSILALGPSSHHWHYIVELIVGDGNTTHAIGAMYSAPPNASFLVPAGSVGARQSIAVEKEWGGWSVSPLGLQHLLPEVNTVMSHEGRTALFTTSARPAANPWGALVNDGEPTDCHSMTAIFDQCTQIARVWVREALPADADTCDPSACEATASIELQCKEAQCSTDGECIFRIDKADGTKCDDGNPDTHHDECDYGTCRGWTLVARQTSPLSPSDAESARGGALVSGPSGTNVTYFDFGLAPSLYKGRRQLDFAMRWPGTAFRMQVWKQASLPWEAHARAIAFEPLRVSVIGFEGLVGGGDDSLAHAPTSVIEVGATSAYFGGLAGPGMLPVGAVELYVRSDGSPQSSWVIAILVIVGLFAGFTSLKAYRKYKKAMMKRLKVLPAKLVSFESVSTTKSEEQLAADTARKRAALMKTKSGKLPTLNRKVVVDPDEVKKELSAVQKLWQVARDAFEDRKKPFKKIKRGRRSQMKYLLKQFKGPNGKIDNAKMMRLQAHQRKALRGELEGHTFKDGLRDDLFIIGTYFFDMMSPSPEKIGHFKPVLSSAMVIVVAILFSFLSGQYGSYELEVRFGECEAEQGVINANMENVSTLTALASSLEATVSGAALAAVQANVTAAAAIEAIWKELEESGKESAGKAAADEGLQAETQTKMNEVTEERGASGHAAAKAVDQQEAAAKGEVTLTQAEIDEAAKVIAQAQALMEEEKSADATLEKSRVATEAEEEAAAQKRALANAQIQQALAAMATQQSKAALEEANAAAQLVETKHALAILNNAYDPWAALRTLDPSLQDSRSVAMLEAKIGAISANGYGAAEHGCSLFMPAPISPVTLGNQMGKWAEPYDAAFLARWGARYAPSIIIEGEGHRWLSSAFVHGSWSQMIICLLNLAVIGAMVERRYGTPRFAALFILSTIGGNFLGAVADDVCVVTVGATAPNLGIIGLFLNDVAVSSVDVDGDGKITLAESKAWAARRRELILCFFVVLLQIAAALSELGLSSITTDLGGFLTGLMLSFLFLPGFLREKWEALVPFVGVAVASIIFIGLPALFYVSHSAQEPICKL